MTPLEAARSMMAHPPTYPGRGNVELCVYCCEPQGLPHISTCEVLVLPRIVAALEAAEGLAQEIADLGVPMDDLGDCRSCGLSLRNHFVNPECPVNAFMTTYRGPQP